MKKRTRKKQKEERKKEIDWMWSNAGAPNPSAPEGGAWACHAPGARKTERDRALECLSPRLLRQHELPRAAVTSSRNLVA